MTELKPFCLIRVFCSIVVALTLALCFSSPGVHFQQTNFSGMASPVGFITKGRVVAQYFVCNFEKVNTLALTLATYCRINRSTLVLTLKNADTQEIICIKKLDASQIQDNSIQNFSLDKVIRKGQKMCLEITSPDADEGNAVTVYMYSGGVKDCGKLLINGVDQGKAAIDLRFGEPKGSRQKCFFCFLTALTALLLLQLWDAYQENRKRNDSPAAGILPRKKKPFDWGMHYFRAFAILCIVIGHYIPSERLVYLFVSDSIFFLFISGYLCQMLSEKGSVLAYYKKKIQNVAFPYIVMTSLSLLLILHAGVFTGMYAGNISVGELPKIYMLGLAHGPYWYMPFILVIFLFSPLFYKANEALFYVFLIISLFCFIVFPYRYSPDNPLTFFRNYSYFTFSYLLGMFYFRFRSSSDLFFRKTWYVFLVLAIFCSCLIVNPDCSLWGMQYSTALLAGLHKLFLIPVVILLLKFLQDRKIWILDQFAKYSFALYFLHCFFLQFFLLDAMPWLSNIFSHAPQWAIFCVLMPVWLLGMLGICMILKCSLGKHSRMIIGA